MWHCSRARIFCMGRVPIAFGRTTENFFKICATFNECKVTDGQHFIILSRQGFLRFLLPEMYPKDGPYFSHTHLTENAFSGILSV